MCGKTAASPPIDPRCAVAHNGAMTAPALSASLEAALLRELGITWTELNDNHFRGALRRPVLTLTDGSGRLGFWDGRARTLVLSRDLVLAQPWGVVREVLKHEMAHQFVDEAMGVSDESAHGPAFEAVCRQHGFDAAARGLPTAGDGVQPNPVLRRIARLLALAESPNRHEAEAAMQQARRLMLRHNIDAATAAAREGFAFRHAGGLRARVAAHEQVLAAILSDHFFVEVIWIPWYVPAEGRRGRTLELTGTPPNLEVAAYVHDFLLQTGERLWRDHRRAAGLPGDRERRRFLLGVMIGFDEKLMAAAAESRREGLIWRGDPALADYLRRRYPRRSGGGSIGLHQTAAYEHGRRAGRGIVLHRPVRGSAESRGRLLPPVS
jgi:hypothetical protein